MTDTAKSIYQGQPGTTDTLLYTATGLTAVVRAIHIQNTSATARTVTLGFNAGAALAAANHFYSAVTIPANDFLDWTGFLVVTSGGTIRALQENATACTFTIAGVEIT